MWVRSCAVVHGAGMCVLVICCATHYYQEASTSDSYCLEVGTADQPICDIHVMTSQPATPTSTVIASGDYAFYTSLVWAKLNTIRPGPARPERRADGPCARAPGPGTSAQDGWMGRCRGAGGSEDSFWYADPVVSGSIPWEAIGRFIFALAALGTG